MSSVSSSSALNGSLSANVCNLAFLGIETLSFGVRLNVLEKGHDVFDRFLWESSIEEVDLLALCFMSNTVVESSERNDGFVFENSLHVFDGCVQVQTSACSGSLVSVFEMCSQVVHSATSSYTIK